MARKRARWKAYQGRIDPSRLLFIDETWVKTNMAPLRGWGPRGRRLKARWCPVSACHPGKAARAAVRARGAHLLFLPPYSPDLNPIEQVFAKLKHLMRKAQPRDVEATWRKVGQLLDLFSPKECANYLANSGYGSV